MFPSSSIHPIALKEKELRCQQTKIMIICGPRSQMLEKEVKTYLRTIMMCEPRSQLLKKEVKTYLSTQSSVFISSMAEALISSIEGQDASQLLKSEGLEGFLEFLDLFCFLPFLDGLVGFLFCFLDSLVFFFFIWKVVLHCTMIPLLTRSCLKSSKLRPILNGQFCHAISKNIGLSLLGSKQPREILVFLTLKL